MNKNLEDFVRNERQQWFVGRQMERSAFQAVLREAERKGAVFFVFGPGGIGKTTLLREWEAMAQSLGVPTAFLDGRYIHAHIPAFIENVVRALGGESETSLEELLGRLPCPPAIFLDGYEALQGLEAWLREDFIPRLPAGSIVVIASRHPPSLKWRTDPGWAQLIRVFPLRNFSFEETAEYLRRRGIPESQHRTAFSLTWGHPLALALVADILQQQPGRLPEIEAIPDLFSSLLEIFLEEVPTPAHRAALEACALVRSLSEPLLAEAIGQADVEALFNWLRRLSFVESGPHGLRLHDVVRESILADLQWRNPERYRDLHRKAQSYYMRRLNELQDPTRLELLVDYIYLHRRHPLLRPFFVELRIRWAAEDTFFIDHPTPSEHHQLLEWIALYEGEISASLAEHWFHRQPDGLIVVRDQSKEIRGFLLALRLEDIAPAESSIDPAIDIALSWLQRHAPLRPGERGLYFRFWMARDTYQDLSPVQSLLGLEMVRLCLTTPRLALSFFPFSNPEFWAPLFAYAEIPRWPHVDFEIGGRRYGVYGQDWRKTPIPLWLARLGKKEAEPVAEPFQPPSDESIVVLNFSDFREAVRQGFRDLHRIDRLAENPLARSRLVLSRTGWQAPAEKRGAQLQQMLLEAARRLQASPKDARKYQALHFTYIEPLGSQERIAERLDLPLSTYRRYLQSALDQITAWLWEQELSA